MAQTLLPPALTMTMTTMISHTLKSQPWKANLSLQVSMMLEVLATMLGLWLLSHISIAPASRKERACPLSVRLQQQSLLISICQYDSLVYQLMLLPAGSIGGRKLLQQAPAAAGPTESHTVGFGRETLADNRVMLIETTSPNITVLVNAIQGDSYAAPLMQESGAGRHWLLQSPCGVHLCS